MATKKQTKKNASPSQHPNVTVVESREAFEREAQRLRESGFTEVPGALGGGSGGGISPDYADYLEAKLACSEGTGKGKTSLPLLHVSSGYAQPVTAANGHKGSYITWGAGNRIPNVISLLCSLLPYTAAALKFNIDLCCGMGPRPMYAYTQYVGGNISQKSIPYDQADKLILGQIRDLQLQLVKLEAEHPELGEGSDLGVASRSDASQGSDPRRRRKQKKIPTNDIPSSAGQKWSMTSKNLLSLCPYYLKTTCPSVLLSKNIRTANRRPLRPALWWRWRPLRAAGSAGGCRRRRRCRAAPAWPARGRRRRPCT